MMQPTVTTTDSSRAGERNMNNADVAALGLAIVGALNWGLVGLFKTDLVAKLFGKHSGLSRTVYAAVGAAGAYAILTAVKAAQEARATRGAAA